MMEHPTSTTTEDTESAQQMILRWDPCSSSELGMIFDGHRHEIHQYLSAIDQISHLSLQEEEEESAAILPDDDDKKKKKKVNKSNIMRIAMARLEDEFRNILISQVDSEPLLSDSSVTCSSSTPRTRTSSSSSFFGNNNTSNKDEEEEGEEEEEELLSEQGESSSLSTYRSMSSIREIDLMPCDSVNDLRLIAQRMIFAGYSRECVQVYATVRKPAVDATFKKLGVDKLSIGDIQRLEWVALNAKIGKWIRAVKLSVRVLFASEKRLCQQIFQGLHSLDDACFAETVKAPAAQLFNFAEAISISRRAPEKLFKILDLHDTLIDLLPDIDAVFQGKSSESFRVQAAEIISRLAEAARGMLNEFESAVLREPSRVPVPGGTIHPLTRYVMNYITLISEYKQTLGELIVARPTTGSRYPDDDTSPDMDFTDHEEQSALALHLIWITVILQFNLEGKSKHYRDNSLAHVFVMNNVHYIVQKIKGSPELREMIGDIYLKKLTGKYRQAATGYQRATWVGVLNCLSNEGLHVSGSFSSGVSKTALRERFKSFNAMFDDVHKTQALWLIPDTRLREELRISISELLIPAYRSFLGRYRGHIESGRHPENYIKYSVEDLETAVLDFFEGCVVSQHSRRRSQ
uniref:exocyst complex component EXO70A1-like n=1 Tax=Erigeron canadensis TaxID=72917 RepID=UPI001CB996A3|nr:exocyst complex component EXO70A1-like [Erigeron canadensis]